MNHGIPFVKMEGCGNDYVYVDAGLTPNGVRAESLGPLPELARAVSDRHTGVGSDGLILLDRSPDGPRMRMFNADGSTGLLCLNGLRCAAKLAADALPELEHAFAVQTGAGPRGVAVADTGPGSAMVIVEVGRADFSREAIPARGDGDELWGEPFPMPTADRFPDELLGYGVSVGNPHLVFWCDAHDLPRGRLLESLATGITARDRFPQGVNIHFASPDDRGDLVVRHWERGSGETRACGTGAVAVFAVARRLDMVPAKATVRMPGGEVVMEQRDDGALVQSGPAREVFRGTWPA